MTMLRTYGGADTFVWGYDAARDFVELTKHSSQSSPRQMYKLTASSIRDCVTHITSPSYARMQQVYPPFPDPSSGANVARCPC
ncbi:uncharacterized protein LACBIDRAFT_310924 [Laccaria bicolor S238N-H82]|uniref:Predicted protein n=1 Tax=Laccaria bicolor (strain S238N-H82 / ATCC MYA-4686) TaxID=486041 RepID=B0DVE4_LACBS|nr:uncharacterized protein LACBIDRAFT_310924 [Laccaria bicolor S238N-H82]EDR01500.1 predicted protein [Laccaria bicolor S238N-H82]|eukprot:XP_001887852.1 predicted protein [Laccaria bicolor S238N-H82]